MIAEMTKADEAVMTMVFLSITIIANVAAIIIAWRGRHG